MRTLIKNGHIIDPARHMSYKADILVENGIISGIIQVKAFDVPVSDIAVDEVIDAEGGSTWSYRYTRSFQGSRFYL